MSKPWFLELLELDEPFDERMAKRAYAVRLKAIDPATDPGGFATLREAYELACETRGRTTDSTAEIEAKDRSPAPQQPRDTAADLFMRFHRELVASDDEDDIYALLDDYLAALRREHVEVIRSFETHLIDALAINALPWRDVVFDAASELFCWIELRDAEPRSGAYAWVAAVENEREALVRQMGPALQSVLRRAASRKDLPDDLVHLWPKIQEASARYPRYVDLHVGAAVRDAWKERYEARHGGMPDVPPAPLNVPPPRRPAVHARAFIAVALALTAFWLYSRLGRETIPDDVLSDRIDESSCHGLTSYIRGHSPRVRGSMDRMLGRCVDAGFVAPAAAERLRASDEDSTSS